MIPPLLGILITASITGLLCYRYGYSDATDRANLTIAGKDFSITSLANKVTELQSELAILNSPQSDEAWAMQYVADNAALAPVIELRRVK